jgi:hypothetical protein
MEYSRAPFTITSKARRRLPLRVSEVIKHYVDLMNVTTIEEERALLDELPFGPSETDGIRIHGTQSIDPAPPPSSRRRAGQP